jgi:hypothetical protein
MVPGVARSTGTANLLPGGIGVRSAYGQPYGSASATPAARPRPSQPTQLLCCAMCETRARMDASSTPPGRSTRSMVGRGTGASAAGGAGTRRRFTDAGSSSSLSAVRSISIDCAAAIVKEKQAKEQALCELKAEMGTVGALDYLSANPTIYGKNMVLQFVIALRGSGELRSEKARTAASNLAKSAHLAGWAQQAIDGCVGAASKD